MPNIKNAVVCNGGAWTSEDVKLFCTLSLPNNHSQKLISKCNIKFTSFLKQSLMRCWVFVLIPLICWTKHVVRRLVTFRVVYTWALTLSLVTDPWNLITMHSTHSKFWRNQFKITEDTSDFRWHKHTRKFNHSVKTVFNCLLPVPVWLEKLHGNGINCSNSGHQHRPHYDQMQKSEKCKCSDDSQFKTHNIQLVYHLHTKPENDDTCRLDIDP